MWTCPHIQLLCIIIMKYSLLILLSFFHLYTNGQDTLDFKYLISIIETQQDVDSLQRNHPSISITKTTKNSKNNNLTSDIKLLKEGEIIQTDTNHFIKLLSKNTSTEFKVKYVFLDANKIGVEKAKSIQNEIIDLFNEGKSFGDLANEYSMDPRKNDGDLDWFPKGRMVPSFENAITIHKKGEIFKSEDKSKNWYFIVLKTHNLRETGSFEYAEITEHKIDLKQDKESSNKELKAFIQFTINQNQVLSKIQFKKITCYNCIENDLQQEFLNQSFATFMETIRNRASSGDLKQNENYTLPVKMLIK